MAQSCRRITPEQILGPLNEAEQKYAPSVLFVDGDVRIFDTGARISVVGTRAPSAEGAELSRRLASEIATRGAVVVSGLARGIDAIAHSAAMAVSGGRTIAIIGTPLDRAYPAENRELQARIAAQHAVVSQFPLGSPTYRGSFPERNRTMALVSDATIIVEAGEKSGTINQGWEAIRLGRPLLLMEHLLGNPALTWPHELCEYGAEPLSIDGLEELLEFLPIRAREKDFDFAF